MWAGLSLRRPRRNRVQDARAAWRSINARLIYRGTVRNRSTNGGPMPGNPSPAPFRTVPPPSAALSPAKTGHIRTPKSGNHVTRSFKERIGRAPPPGQKNRTIRGKEMMGHIREHKIFRNRQLATISHLAVLLASFSVGITPASAREAAEARSPADDQARQELTGPHRVVRVDC